MIKERILPALGAISTRWLEKIAFSGTRGAAKTRRCHSKNKYAGGQRRGSERYYCVGDLALVDNKQVRVVDISRGRIVAKPTGVGLIDRYLVKHFQEYGPPMEVELDGWPYSVDKVSHRSITIDLRPPKVPF